MSNTLNKMMYLLSINENANCQRFSARCADLHGTVASQTPEITDTKRSVKQSMPKLSPHNLLSICLRAERVSRPRGSGAGGAGARDQSRYLGFQDVALKNLLLAVTPLNQPVNLQPDHDNLHPVPTKTPSPWPL
jgi:hypothetical protein